MVEKEANGTEDYEFDPEDLDEEDIDELGIEEDIDNLLGLLNEEGGGPGSPCHEEDAADEGDAGGEGQAEARVEEPAPVATSEDQAEANDPKEPLVVAKDTVGENDETVIIVDDDDYVGDHLEEELAAMFLSQQHPSDGQQQAASKAQPPEIETIELESISDGELEAPESGECETSEGECPDSPLATGGAKPAPKSPSISVVVPELVEISDDDDANDPKKTKKKKADTGGKSKTRQRSKKSKLIDKEGGTGPASDPAVENTTHPDRKSSKSRSEHRHESSRNSGDKRPDHRHVSPRNAGDKRPDHRTGVSPRSEMGKSPHVKAAERITVHEKSTSAEVRDREAERRAITEDQRPAHSSAGASGERRPGGKPEEPSTSQAAILGEVTEEEKKQARLRKYLARINVYKIKASRILKSVKTNAKSPNGELKSGKTKAKDGEASPSPTKIKSVVVEPAELSVVQSVVTVPAKKLKIAAEMLNPRPSKREKIKFKERKSKGKSCRSPLVPSDGASSPDKKRKKKKDTSPVQACAANRPVVQPPILSFLDSCEGQDGSPAAKKGPPQTKYVTPEARKERAVSADSGLAVSPHSDEQDMFITISELVKQDGSKTLATVAEENEEPADQEPELKSLGVFTKVLFKDDEPGIPFLAGAPPSPRREEPPPKRFQVAATSGHDDIYDCSDAERRSPSPSPSPAPKPKSAAKPAPNPAEVHNKALLNFASSHREIEDNRILLRELKGSKVSRSSSSPVSERVRSKSKKRKKHHRSPVSISSSSTLGSPERRRRRPSPPRPVTPPNYRRSPPRSVTPPRRPRSSPSSTASGSPPPRRMLDHHRHRHHHRSHSRRSRGRSRSRNRPCPRSRSRSSSSERPPSHRSRPHRSPPLRRSPPRRSPPTPLFRPRTRSRSRSRSRSDSRGLDKAEADMGQEKRRRLKEEHERALDLLRATIRKPSAIAPLSMKPLSLKINPVGLDSFEVCRADNYDHVGMSEVKKPDYGYTKNLNYCPRYPPPQNMHHIPYPPPLYEPPLYYTPSAYPTLHHSYY